MKYLNSTIKKYLVDLSAKTPAPGGGSAAALSLAMAASLVSMGCRFSIGKEKYRRWENRLKKDLLESLNVQCRASGLIDEDIAAYRLKDFKKAISVPAQVCRLSCQTMGLVYELLRCGNKNLTSDTAMALLLAELSFVTGFFYVQANIKFLKKSTKEHKKLLKELTSLSKKIKKIKKRAEVEIGTTFRW